jgi:hypothetical protein
MDLAREFVVGVEDEVLALGLGDPLADGIGYRRTLGNWGKQDHGES